MKKHAKKLLLLLVLVIVTVIFVTNISIHLDAAMGKWLYGADGSKIGCKSPGTDCIWVI